MAAEYQVPMDSTLVLGRTLKTVGGEKAGTPSSPFKEGHVEAFLRMVVAKGSDNASGVLRMITDYHRRSYQFGKGVFWTDEFDNLYGKINVKGNNSTEPGAFKSETAPSGFVITGMQLDDSIVRILRASKILRANNVGTEVIIKVIEPMEFPSSDGRRLSRREFKRKLIDEAKSGGLKYDGFDEISPTDIPLLAQVLGKTNPIITVRGLEVSERLGDLYDAETYSDLVRLLDEAFKFVNMSETRKTKKDPSYKPEHFSTDEKNDVERYLTQYLPDKIGRNLAKLHKLGLVHVYPHRGNISLTGAIYDLDSVKGEPLDVGDEPVTYIDIIHDLAYLLDNFHVEGSIRTMGEEEGYDFKKKFLNKFADSYFEEVGDLEKVLNIDLRLDPVELMALLTKEFPAVIRAIGETVVIKGDLALDMLGALQHSIAIVEYKRLIREYRSAYPGKLWNPGTILKFANQIANQALRKAFLSPVELSQAEFNQRVADTGSYETIEKYREEFYRLAFRRLGIKIQIFPLEPSNSFLDRLGVRDKFVNAKREIIASSFEDAVA